MKKIRKDEKTIEKKFEELFIEILNLKKEVFKQKKHIKTKLKLLNNEVAKHA